MPKHQKGKNQCNNTQNLRRNKQVHSILGLGVLLSYSSQVTVTDHMKSSVQLKTKLRNKYPRVWITWNII